MLSDSRQFSVAVGDFASPDRRDVSEGVRGGRLTELRIVARIMCC